MRKSEQNPGLSRPSLGHVCHVSRHCHAKCSQCGGVGSHPSNYVTQGATPAELKEFSWWSTDDWE